MKTPPGLAASPERCGPVGLDRRPGGAMTVDIRRTPSRPLGGAACGSHRVENGDYRTVTSRVLRLHNAWTTSLPVFDNGIAGVSLSLTCFRPDSTSVATR